MEQHSHETKHIEIDLEKVWAVVAYLFFPLPLICAKNRSNFLNYHINQAIIFTLVFFIGNFIFGILNILGWAFKICMAIVFIMQIVTISKKEKEPLPIIGDVFDFVK